MLPSYGYIYFLYFSYDTILFINLYYSIKYRSNKLSINLICHCFFQSEVFQQMYLFNINKGVGECRRISFLVEWRQPFCCALFHQPSQTLHFSQIKVLGQPFLRQGLLLPFLATFAPFMSLCHILVILTPILVCYCYICYDGLWSVSINITAKTSWRPRRCSEYLAVK